MDSRVIEPECSNRLMEDSDTPDCSAKVLRERFLDKRNDSAFFPSSRAISPGLYKKCISDIAFSDHTIGYN
ncbi:hypothetical protein D3C84_1258790 [compost metagenome]